MSGLLLLALTLSAPPDLTAVGIVRSRAPGSAVAILRSGGRTRVVGVGESAFGGRVLAVEATAVTLEFEGGRVDVPLASTAAPQRTSTDLLGGRPPAAAAPTMERRDVERRLGEEVPRILAETTLVPVTEDGHVTGLAITRIPAGTLLTDAGLLPGDILTRINDTPIDGLPSLIALWPRLQSAKELRAIVIRNSQPVTLAVTLR